MDHLDTTANGTSDHQRRLQVVRVARAIKYMLASLDRPYDLEAVASAACISRYHFVRQFRTLTGLSPERFQLKLRLQRAAWSLISGEQPITDVALGAGFESPDGFARAFKRMYGVAPSAFRRLGADPWSGFSRFGFWRPRELDCHPLPEAGAAAMELKQLPAMIYAGARNVGPYNTVGPAFERIGSWAAAAGLIRPETKLIGLSWDNPSTVEAERLRYDAAITLEHPVETPDDIRIAALPAMTWATTVHKGSYARMPQSFMQLGDEVGSRADLVFAPLCALEIYLNTPGDTPEPELLTEIAIPVVQIG